MDDITLWPTYRQAAAIAKGELASRELLDAQLARIEAANPALNAVVNVDAERVGRRPAPPTTPSRGASRSGRSTACRSP